MVTAKDNKQFALEAVRNDPYWEKCGSELNYSIDSGSDCDNKLYAFQFISKRLQNDKEIIKEAIKINSDVFNFIPKKFKDDDELKDIIKL